MLQTSLPKAILNETASQFQQEMAFPFYENAMKKGLKLYREGFVYNAALLDDGLVQANVLDRQIYKPILDLTDLPQSHCECSSSYICPHIFALFFYLYANVGSVGELVRKWNIKRTSVAPKLPKASEVVQPSASVHDWVKRFEHFYDQFLQNYRTIDYWFAHHLCYRFFPSLLEGVPYAGIEKRLYDLHAALFTFCRLVESGEQFQRISYQRSFWESAISDFVGVIHNKCSSFLNKPAPNASLLDESRKYVRNVLFASEGFMAMRIRVYQMVWNALFRGETWCEKEQEALQKRQEESSFADECLLALAHLAFLRGRDEEVSALLKDVRVAAIPYVLHWMRELALAGQWTRMKTWWELCMNSINLLFASSHYYKAEVTRELLYLSERYTHATGDQKHNETILRALLPYSASQYSHFLMSSKQYKKWVDLHLIAGIEIEEIHRSFLTTIEKHDRSLLLPLYHRGVQKMIQAKNRPSYKQAVRYLKKLRTYYRALGRYDVWLVYREKLLEKTKRLRAFHEEMQKGKLLHD
ncbi:hypothetical protein HNQ34_001283 [Anoxybacillus tepidamans]|uniref:SWIM-type domain-containing protein n=1 Tax=Anoxybacteroides tepidamans TaxID=265948 RepID=A0A7W8IPC0_9BACL|nr:hypothetical protein [Anoxybacillus tepidamans]MBB5324190.1 hypothetical protein [Anoxybacillus tepidamans]